MEAKTRQLATNNQTTCFFLRGSGLGKSLQPKYILFPTSAFKTLRYMKAVSTELSSARNRVSNRATITKAIMTKLIISLALAVSAGCMPFDSGYRFSRASKAAPVATKSEQKEMKVLPNIRQSFIELFRQSQPSVQKPSAAREIAKVKKIGNKMDVCSVGHTTAEELERHFAKYKKSPLKGKGEFFLKMEKKYGISARFIAAIATIESGCGTHCANKNNFFGVKGGKRGYRAFSSVEDGIESEFSMIKRVYINQNRTTVASIGKKYCTNGKWAGMVSGVMKKI